MTKTLIHVSKMMIAEWAIFMVFFCWLFDRERIDQGRRALSGVLLFLAALSALAYFDYGIFYKYGQFLNPHDFFHYYVGAKYSREVGTYDLYKCALIADREANAAYTRSSIRNLEDHSFVSVRTVLEDADACKARFTEDRWREFRKDVRYFQSLLSDEKWQRVLYDKGYNATPVWNMVARFLTNRVPTDSKTGMTFLLSLDLILLALMFVFIGKAFGWRTMLFAVIFTGVNFMLSFTHSRGALLRFDWFTLLAISVCMIKMDRYKAAGALMGYATLARVFPVVFVFGMGAKFFWDFIRHRRLNRKYAGFFVAFLITVAALVGLSVVLDGGLERWQEFSHKISVHNKDISSTRVGFKYIFLDAFGLSHAAFAEHQGLWWTIQAVVLLLSFYLVKCLEDYEAVAFGFVPVFFLVAPTFYYYAMLIVPLLFFAPKLERFPHAFGLGLMFSATLTWFMLHRALPFGTTLYLIISYLLLGFVVYMIAVAAGAHWRSWRREEGAGS